MRIKDIQGFNGRYSITDDGSVISNDYKRTGNKKVLTPFKDRYGYYRVRLRKDGENYKDYPIHRLVATAFCTRPTGKNYIDHIDGNPENNRAENLRWCTQKENCNNPIAKKHYSEMRLGKKAKFKNGINPNAKPIIQIDAETNEVIAEYPSQTNAAKANKGFKQSEISKCCLNSNRTYKGYKFRFK